MRSTGGKDGVRQTDGDKMRKSGVGEVKQGERLGESYATWGGGPGASGENRGPTGELENTQLS